MRGKRILVVGGSARSAAIVEALIAAGADVVAAENADAIPRKQEFSGAWVDECWPVGTIDDKRKTYGPPKKGTGGKVRRW